VTYVPPCAPRNISLTSYHASISQLFTAGRNLRDTIYRLHPRTSTAPRIHTRASASRAWFNVNCTVLRRAILGAQFVLRAHVLRAFARLGAHRRDGERRERREPCKNLRLDRALGGRAQETPAWSRPVSHFGVLVNVALQRRLLS
jgi:hypothetical protein